MRWYPRLAKGKRRRVRIAKDGSFTTVSGCLQAALFYIAMSFNLLKDAQLSRLSQ